MLRTYRYRLMPTKTQTHLLERQLALCQQLYNAALQERRDAYRQRKATITVYDQMKHLVEIKTALPEYQGVYSQVLQDVLKRLDKTFRAFYRRLSLGEKPSYPRFQSQTRYSSLCYPQSGFSVSTKTAFFSKIGNIRIKLHRPVEGTIKTATLRRDQGQWYVTYVCDVPSAPLPPAGQTVGVYLDDSLVALTSRGVLSEHPLALTPLKHKVQVAQRAVERKQRHSNRQRSAQRRLKQLQRTTRRTQLDAFHKAAARLIRENDLIVTGRSAPAPHPTHFPASRRTRQNLFVSILSQKAECAARKIVVIDLASLFPSTILPRIGRDELALLLAGAWPTDEHVAPYRVGAT